MKLPFAEEIASLRARIEDGQAARTLEQRLNADLTAVSIVEVQHAGGLPVPDELPGEDLVQLMAAHFPALADLPAVGRGLTDFGARLNARRQQLMLAQQHLAPQLSGLEELAGEMHELQHRQHDELEKPEWAEAVEELKELGYKRDQLAQQIIPLRTRAAHVDPVRQLLLAFHPQLQEELVQAARTEDRDGRIAWRCGVIAREQLLGLAEVAAQMGLVVGMPPEPMLPDEPHPRHRRRLRAEAGAVLEWMVAFSRALEVHGTALEEQIAGLEAEQARYEDALKDRMG